MDTLSARSLMLNIASLSALGYENSLEQPAIRLWNETRHLLTSNEWETDANGLQLTEVTR